MAKKRKNTPMKKLEKQKIHIMHLINSLVIGGAEVALLNYIQALGQEDYEHYVYSFGHDGPIRKKVEDLGVQVYFGPKGSTIKNPIKFGASLVSLVRDLLNFLRSKRIQIIHSHLGQANQLAVLVGKLSGIPAFPTIHNTNAFVDRRSTWDPRVSLIKIVNAIIYRKADRVVTISQEAKDIIRHSFGLEDSQVVVLKNGIIVTDDFTKSESLEKEFPDSRNKLKLIAIGRLTYQKYFEILIKAAAEVINQGLDLLVLILGDGEERSRLEGLIRGLRVGGYVKLLGIRYDAMKLMKGSDAFVMPSRYEGLSIAMIEAMACGLPVIASDAPGLRGYINYGENGFFFQVGDHKALAEYILLLAKNKILMEKLSKGARDTFEREYDIRENIKPLEALFRNCVKRPMKRVN